MCYANSGWLTHDFRADDKAMWTVELFWGTLRESRLGRLRQGCYVSATLPVASVRMGVFMWTSGLTVGSRIIGRVTLISSVSCLPSRASVEGGSQPRPPVTALEALPVVTRGYGVCASPNDTIANIIIHYSQTGGYCYYITRELLVSPCSHIVIYC